MNLVMKILGILILIALGVGFYYRSQEEIILGDRIIGVAVLATAFVLMPIFLVVRWKGKKLEDYTFSDKNMKKMRENQQK